MCPLMAPSAGSSSVSVAAGLAAAAGAGAASGAGVVPAGGVEFWPHPAAVTNAITAKRRRKVIPRFYRKSPRPGADPVFAALTPYWIGLQLEVPMSVSTRLVTAL